MFFMGEYYVSSELLNNLLNNHDSGVFYLYFYF